MKVIITLVAFIALIGVWGVILSQKTLKPHAPVLYATLGFQISNSPIYMIY